MTWRERGIIASETVVAPCQRWNPRLIPLCMLIFITLVIIICYGYADVFLECQYFAMIVERDGGGYRL